MTIDIPFPHGDDAAGDPLTVSHPREPRQRPADHPHRHPAAPTCGDTYVLGGAKDLVIAKATVKSYIRHILAKLHLRERAQAALKAHEHGLVQSHCHCPAEDLSFMAWEDRRPSPNTGGCDVRLVLAQRRGLVAGSNTPGKESA